MNVEKLSWALHADYPCALVSLVQEGILQTIKRETVIPTTRPLMNNYECLYKEIKISMNVQNNYIFKKNQLLSVKYKIIYETTLYDIETQLYNTLSHII